MQAVALRGSEICRRPAPEVRAVRCECHHMKSKQILGEKTFDAIDHDHTMFID
jgi:hypothetical protein